MYGSSGHIHLLKLVTGVEISTLPVKVSGNPGKLKSSNRTAAAPAKSAAVLLSMLLEVITKKLNIAVLLSQPYHAPTLLDCLLFTFRDVDTFGVLSALTS
jgi:hypothetical protein